MINIQRGWFSFGLIVIYDRGKIGCNKSSENEISIEYKVVWFEHLMGSLQDIDQFWVVVSCFYGCKINWNSTPQMKLVWWEYAYILSGIMG